MRRGKRLLFFILLFFIIDINVFAFTGNYNYEVKTLNRDEDGVITISGWAIPNAGVTDYKSPSLKPNRGSGSTSSCKGSSSNYYTYSLYVVPLDENLKYKSDLSDAIKIGSKKGSGTDLTSIMCYTSGGSCVSYRSPCYENVGWSFSYNESIIKNAKFIHGYIFFLKIVTSGDNHSVSFPLVAYSSRVTGFGNDYKYLNGTQIGNDMKIEVVAYDGYYQKCSGGVCGRKSNTKFSHGRIYSVLGVTTKKSNGLTYYKVGNNLYIPASWVAPPTTSIGLIPGTPGNVDSCVDQTISQEPSTKTINACAGNKDFSGINYNSCSVDNYEYYIKKCEENNFNANLNINNSGTTTSKFQLTNGAGITAEANISTNFVCSYTFDTKKFKEDYDLVLHNLSYYDENDPEYFVNYNIKTKLDDILENYIKETNSLSDWESGYDFTKVDATLTVLNKSKKLVQDDLTKTSSCIVNTKNDLNLSGTNYKINSSVTCEETYKVLYNLPNACLNMKTGEPEDCVAGSKTQIDGGKKYYIDMSSKNANIELIMTGLGFDGNWDIKLTNCAYEVPETLKEQIVFRQIDLTDPFLQTYEENRSIGENYSNTNYNFVNIIKSDTWERTFDYRYSMSKVNIENIKRDTKEEGVSSYLGRICYFNDNNKYVCDFTRNKKQTGDSNQIEWFKSEVNYE